MGSWKRVLCASRAKLQTRIHTGFPFSLSHVCGHTPLVVISAPALLLSRAFAAVPPAGCLFGWCFFAHGSFNMLAQPMASSKMFPYVPKNQLKKGNRGPRVCQRENSYCQRKIRAVHDPAGHLLCRLTTPAESIVCLIVYGVYLYGIPPYPHHVCRRISICRML